MPGTVAVDNGKTTLVQHEALLKERQLKNRKIFHWDSFKNFIKAHKKQIMVAIAIIVVAAAVIALGIFFPVPTSFGLLAVAVGCLCISSNKKVEEDEETRRINAIAALRVADRRCYGG